MQGGGEDTGPSREESGTVPAICLALLGLAGLPADGELVRGAHKQRQCSPAHPQGHCLFVWWKKVEHIQQQGEVVEGRRERKGENYREKCDRANGKMLMRE